MKDEVQIYVDSKKKEVLSLALEVPGVRYDERTSSILGSFDAVSESARAFSLELPEPPRKAKPHHLTAFDSIRTRGVPLRDYQVNGIHRLLSIVPTAGGALLSDDMGLGKTRQASVFAFSATERTGGRVLVVCPAAVRGQWESELRSVFGDNTAISVAAPGVFSRTVDEFERARVVVTSYELADQAIDAMGTYTPTVLILDEAHQIKGRKSKRKDKIKEIAAKCTFRLALTGTPMWSRPKDYWELLNILFAKRIAKSGYEFDMRYCDGKHSEHGFDNKGVSNAEELKRRLGYYTVRRTKSEVLSELPPLTRTFRWVEGTPGARVALETAVIKKTPGSFGNALTATLREKIPAAVECAIEARQFVLFTWIKAHAHEIGKKIQEAGVPVFVITGDMAASEREALVKRAADERVGVVATIDSIGTGVNMQKVASIGIFHALDYVPAKLMQAEARIHRMGQTQGVNWTYIAMKNSADEMVVNHIVSKLDMWQSTMPATSGDGSSDLQRDVQSSMSVGGDEEILMEMLREAP